jgi:hypothetical protein
LKFVVSASLRPLHNAKLKTTIKLDECSATTRRNDPAQWTGHSVIHGENLDAARFALHLQLESPSVRRTTSTELEVVCEKADYRQRFRTKAMIRKATA